MKILFAIALGLIIFFVIRFFHKHRLPPMSDVTLVSGGVKCGKTSFAVWVAVYNHFTRFIGVKIHNFFHRKKLREMPFLYTNIPLRYKWARKLTIELLTRKERFAYGSIVYVNEASLLADSLMYKDQDFNDALTLFNKLFGHETLGGLLIYDTQNLADCHFSIKRCLSEYVYLNGKRKRFGMLFLNYRRMKMSGMNDCVDVNVFDGKEEEIPFCIVPTFIWKIVDCFAFSALTDDLPVSALSFKGTDLKVRELLTINNTRFLAERTRLREMREKKDFEKGVSLDVENKK